MSDEDFPEISKYRWHVDSTGYASRAVFRNGKRTKVRMHREIMKPERGKVCDHLNGNTLDNRRENLRVCTVKENNENRINNRTKWLGKSRYKGVRKVTKSNKWQAIISFKGKEIYLGSFELESEAALRYDEEARKLYGDRAHTNF